MDKPGLVMSSGLHTRMEASGGTSIQQSSDEDGVDVAVSGGIQLGSEVGGGGHVGIRNAIWDGGGGDGSPVNQTDIGGGGDD